MRRRMPALLLTAAVAACTAQSGVETTPTFAPARLVPQVMTPTPVPGLPPTPARPARRLSGRDGATVVSRANRSATVDPDESTMEGATWVIDDVASSSIYRVRTATGRVTTILLPPGERFNGAVGGDVENFLINVAYAGPRPAVSILPRSRAARGNLQLVTTGGFYSFDLLVNEWVAMNLVDVGREGATPRAAASDLPQPQGDFTRLAPVADDTPRPAWAPAEAWADSTKMVIRFNGPLPTLPTLFAGQQGEQLVSYRSRSDGQQVYLITSRRVTEAELRLGDEKVRLTVDADAIGSGAAADPAQGASGWRPAEPVPPPSAATGSPVLLMVQPPPAAPATAPAPPSSPGTVPGGTILPQPAGAAPPPALQAPEPVAPPARQPMADHLLERI